MDSFLIALQFLTRIPVSRSLPHDDAAVGRSVLYYPVVGFLLGLVLSGLALALAAGPDMVAAAVVLTAWVWLTGGLHLDGLADCADACVGGLGDRQRSLAIMKDPAAGPIAVVVLLLVLLLKWAAVLALLQQNNFICLLAAPILGRSAVLLLMLSTPYVRTNGVAEKMTQHFPFVEARWVVVISLVFVGVLMGWANVLLAGVLLLWLRYAALVRLGGVTGDVYGAAVELIETAALLAVVLL
ncbi:adenosylcobinamide-GDP ribazoletransferase [Methylomonas rapida]|uniref:Adenosylcobinamide-GDP ribazoletransferase n=1 Tax=Methylomonas rapida TaxID=2963939 RepID=A0ABY7GKP8_9GAMM|nr:adenosylcobinamide-GDP ribazoletransferase [Methylomonas rapida]WAR45085.1 adenosylcobinamide-GDP ribazoletransferase [Methylomonas rapida]